MFTDNLYFIPGAMCNWCFLGRKRGRPRKGEGKATPAPPEEKVETVKRPRIIEKGQIFPPIRCCYACLVCLQCTEVNKNVCHQFGT